jgi:hypothetical protein
MGYKLEIVLGFAEWYYDRAHQFEDNLAKNLFDIYLKDGNVKWDGSSFLANNIFGENYGIDWLYLPNSSSIDVHGKIYNVGDLIKLL